MTEVPEEDLTRSNGGTETNGGSPAMTACGRYVNRETTGSANRSAFEAACAPGGLAIYVARSATAGDTAAAIAGCRSVRPPLLRSSV
jgi:hypothetical protein